MGEGRSPRGPESHAHFWIVTGSDLAPSAQAAHCGHFKPLPLAPAALRGAQRSEGG